jgi:hypothetical protein
MKLEIFVKFVVKFSVEIFTRNPDRTNGIEDHITVELCQEIGAFKADIIFICVPDHAVEQVINSIPSSKTIIVTGGSIDLKKLNRPLSGVFYPMQTFSAQVELTFINYPVFIEGTTPEITSKLEELANAIGKISQRSTYADRVHYHLSAVWVNNFTNHLLYQAKELAEENNLNWDLFYPLLEETIAKMKSLGPYDSQTGPAKLARVSATHARTHAHMCVCVCVHVCACACVCVPARSHAH